MDDAVQMLTPGAILQNRYRIVGQLGKGGMGTVYEARALRLNTTVALKETHFTDDRLRKQFEREAQLLAGLRHPALPRVIDHFDEGEGLFLVMDYVEGDDLWEMLQKQNDPFPISDVLRWADQLLDALAYMHSQEPPVIHRDIKPQNLKLARGGQIILLDFGLAKGFAGQLSRVTTSGSIFGYTPNYSPLEQIHGTGTDARSDLYSLGATLYNLATGKVPPDVLTRQVATTDGEPDPLLPADRLNSRVPQSVAGVLSKAMSVGRSQRYASAAEMREAIRSAARGRAAQIGPASDEANIPTLPSPLETIPLSRLEKIVRQEADPDHPDEEETRLPVADARAVEFIGDDRAYLRWLNEHPTGYVLNTTSSKIPAYMVLHRATCPHIGRPDLAPDGGFTERHYVKVCSEQIDPLSEWVIRPGRQDGSFSSECKTCDPIARPAKLSSTGQLQLEYWTALADILRRAGSAVKLKEPRAQYSITAPMSHSHAELVAAANTKDGRIAVGVWVRGSKDVFRALRDERADIESEIARRDPGKAQDFLWLENEDEAKSDIWLRWHGANIGERGQWREYLEWHREKLEAFYAAFEPRLRRLEIQAAGAGAGNLRTPGSRPTFNGARREEESGSVASVDEPVVAININQQFPYVRTAEDLYNCTRSMWRVNRQRAERARYAFSIYQGVIREVYRIIRWRPATQETIRYWEERNKSQGRYFPPEVDHGRSEFVGEVAPETVRQKYIGRRLPKRHSQNPILYFNC